MTQDQALDILKLGHNVFLTGSAGSGKTYLLNKYIQYLKSNDIPVAVTASTGIAASHMNGMTIHSWSGLGIRATLTEYDLEAMEEKRYLWERFTDAKILIIDEISMLHHYRLDLVERIARFFKRNELPFGGMQVILCGDFFQLPPVARPSEPEAHFAHHAQAWEALDLKICYLEESHRQNDDAYLSILNAVRKNSVSSDMFNMLRERFNKDTTTSVARPTKLYTHNIDVDGVNARELELVEGPIAKYVMSEDGNPAIALSLKKNCLAPETLALKKGAQVMFVKNNYEAGYVNGTLGTVVECGRFFPTVRTVQGRLIEAKSADWSIEEDQKIKAKISQVPLRLAWAITVHKSQGMTLDAAEIDLSKSFEKGMGYVALSRVKSLDGLKLIGLNEKALQVDEDILMFDEDLQESSQKTAVLLMKLSSEEKTELQKKFLHDATPKAKNKKPKKIETHLETKVLLLKKWSLKDIAEERNLKEDTILSHIEKLFEEGDVVDIAHLKPAAPSVERMKKIHDAFKVSFVKNGDYRFSPVKIILGEGYSYQEIRLARLFLTKE
jgi:ATP-dependent DNA helicase PIF1